MKRILVIALWLAVVVALVLLTAWFDVAGGPP